MKPYYVFFIALLSLTSPLQCMEQGTNSANRPKMSFEDKKPARDALLIKLGELVLIGLPQAAEAICKACLNDEDIPEELLPALLSTGFVAIGQENPDETLKESIKHHSEELIRQYQNFRKYYDQKVLEKKRVEDSPTAIRAKGFELNASLSRMRSQGHKQAAAAYEKACRENKPITDEKALKQLRYFGLLGETEKKPNSNNAFAIKNSPSKSPSQTIRKK